MVCFVILSFCLCESHDVYFLYYFSLCICIHLSIFQLCYELVEAAVGYFMLRWKLQNVSRHLGVLRTFVAFVFHVFFLLMFFLLFFFFSSRKSTSWVKYIECGLTQALTMFLYCATRSSFHFPVCDIYCTQRFYSNYYNLEKSFVHTFLSSQYDLLRSLNFTWTKKTDDFFVHW